MHCLSVLAVGGAALASLGEAQFTFTTPNIATMFVTVTDLRSSVHTLVKALESDPCSSVCEAKQTLLAMCQSDKGPVTSCYCTNGYQSALQGCNDCKSSNGDDGFFSFLPAQVSADCARITGDVEPTTRGARVVTDDTPTPTETAGNNSEETAAESSISSDTAGGSGNGSGGFANKPQLLISSLLVPAMVLLLF